MRRKINHPKTKLSYENIEVIRQRRSSGELVKILSYDYNVVPSLISMLTRDLSNKKMRSNAKRMYHRS